MLRHRILILNVGLAVVLIVVGVVIWSTLHSSAPAVAAGRTTTVERGTVTASVSGSGNASSGSTTGVSFANCSGTLTSLHTAVGDDVAAGQVLATLDPSNAKESLTTAQLNYDSALTNRTNALNQAADSLSSAQTSYTDDLQSNQESVDSAQTSLSTAESTLSGANTKVSAAVAAYQAATGRAATSALQSYNQAHSAQTQAQSQVTNASSQLTQANQKLAQAKTRDASAITSAQTKLTQTRETSSQSAMAVRSASMALASAKTAVSDCTLRSPTAGTVTAVAQSVGASVTGKSGGANNGTSSSATSATTATGGLITLQDMKHLVIATDLSESDVTSVKVGDTASVVFSALTSSANPNGTTVAAKVTAVSPTSTVTNSVVDYGVTVALTNPPSTLRLGQTGSVTINTGTQSNALYVLSSAITTTGPTKTVSVQDGTGTTVIRVTTGLVGDSTTQIVSGVSAGAVLVLPTTTASSSSLNNGGIPGGSRLGAGGLGGGSGRAAGGGR